MVISGFDPIPYDSEQSVSGAVGYGYLSPETRSTPPKMHSSFRWATHIEHAAGLHVRDVGTFDLSERHSADEVGGCVNVCQYG